MSIVDINSRKIRKLTMGKQVNCINVIVNLGECLLTFSTIEEEDIIINTFESTMIDKTIYYAQSLSVEYDLPIKFYIAHMVFREEYPSRKWSAEYKK